MSFIGEAALSVFLEMLFDKLASSAFNFVTDYKKVHEELKEWEKKLSDIQAVLNDAEQKQITDQHVKNWLADLQDLAYDVDDILDEFAYDAKRQASTSKKRKFFDTFCITGTASFMSKNTMISNIKKITDRLSDLETRRSSLGLSKIIMSEGMKGMKARLQPTCVMDETVKYVGRDNEKREILELLKSGTGAEDGVSVITIVGPGGMGKTTLAQLVYNDATIKDSFDHMAWVCVSVDFDAINITKSILKFITSESCDDNNLSLLQVKLKDKLSGKRFLLVLDDIWNESYDDWTTLRSPFGTGTKIIVTTRLQKVSSNVVTKKAFQLDKLSYDDCLSIFAQHALRARDFNADPELKEVGENIVRRCSGLPLAAKAIGGILRTTRDPVAWENIYKSEIWDLPEDQCGIIPALRLSYHHLPPHLKRCFAYCSILPKDYEFDEEKIILLWRAEGLLKQKAQSEINDFGNKCFRELISRSFFQKSGGKDESRYVMHDLINDLAQSVAGNICSKLEDDEQQKISNRTRHSSYVCKLYDRVEKFEAFGEVNSLRTFLPLWLSKFGEQFLTSFVLDDLLPRLKCLRVLSLNGYCIFELPDFFKDLKHLRYLDFSGNEIKCLPDSLCTLYHLETLILKECRVLERLPSEIGNLTELHYLDITGANRIKTMPFGIGKLTKLQRLSNFILGEGDDGDHIRELRNLSNLKGEFCLSELKHIVKHQDAQVAKLYEKSGIERLTLQWSGNFYNCTIRNKEVEERVLESLRPPQKKLQQLTILNYGGAKFSAWIADSSFKNMSSLKLINCKHCKSLPSIGKLPVLKDLLICGMNEIDKVGVELFGANQPNALETLTFGYMPNWTEWDPCEGDEQQVSKFPSLRELSISKCPQLSGRLPTRLPSLRKLDICKCTRLVVSISSFPSLCELKINGCEELVDECCAEEVNSLSLQSVYLSDISKFSISPERIVSRFSNLEYFEIEDFEELVSLSQKGLGLLGHRCIRIENCPQLVSLETEEVDVEKLQSSGIQSLKIRNCERLNRLPKGLYALKFLTEMQISKCPGFVSFAENKLPPTLMKLKIWDCENLQHLVDERKNKSISSNTLCLLEHLEIEKCPSLICISSRADTLSHLQHLQVADCLKLSSLFLNAKLPTRLKQLRIWGYVNFECIAQDFHGTTGLESISLYSCYTIKSLPPGLDKLSQLQKIEISKCPNLVFNFEESGLPPATNLRVFSINSCQNFGALPNCINNFTSLQRLMVCDCAADISFPEEGFPTNLTSLQISKAHELYRSLVEWGLDRLTSLQHLDISGELYMKYE